MKPYFQSKHTTLYHGDCLEIMPELAAGSVDAVVTDPPYGLNPKKGDMRWYESRYDGGYIIGDKFEFDPAFLFHFDNLILWGCNHFIDNLPAGSYLIWDKRTKNHLDKMFGEPCEMAYMKSTGKSHLNILRLQHGGVVNADSAIGNNTERQHPTQKPVALMEWCLSFFPNAQIILDPFMGSGTTGVACCKTNRQFIGIEMEEKYVEIAAKRIERAEIDAAQNLFLEPEPVTPAKQEVMPL